MSKTQGRAIAPILLTAAACDFALSEPKQGTPLVGTRWKIVELRSKPVSPEPGKREAFLQLQGDDNRYAASAGCNGMGGEYTTSGSEVRFKPGPTTMMACGEPYDERERDFGKALQSASSFKIAGPLLELRDGETVLVKLQSTTAREGLDNPK